MIFAGEEIVEELHPGGPRHCAEAAAEQHERAVPSVKPPHALPGVCVQQPPPIEHGAAGQSAGAIRGDLLGDA